MQVLHLCNFFRLKCYVKSKNYLRSLIKIRILNICDHDLMAYII